MNCDRPGDQFGGNRGQNKVPTAKAAMAGSRRRANSHDFRFQAKAAPTLNFFAASTAHSHLLNDGVTVPSHERRFRRWPGERRIGQSREMVMAQTQLAAGMDDVSLDRLMLCEVAWPQIKGPPIALTRNRWREFSGQGFSGGKSFQKKAL
jgi:hypothetical protein